MLTVKIEVAEAPADASHATGQRRQGRAAVPQRHARETLARRRAGWSGADDSRSDAADCRRRESLDGLRVQPREREERGRVRRRHGSASLNRKGTAYVLALGVNQYENAQYNLKFAVADATAFADEIEGAAGEARAVRSRRSDRVARQGRDQSQPAPGVEAAGRQCRPCRPAPRPHSRGSHRRSRKTPSSSISPDTAPPAARDSIWCPTTWATRGTRAGVDAQAVETILAHSVSDLELEAAVEGLDAGQLVLVIDACNSGQALEAEEKRRGPMNSKGLAQLAYEKGMYILTAAQSYQAALETSQLGHGYLTFTLVEEGLKKGMADLGQKDGLVSVREWFDYATRARAGDAADQQRHAPAARAGRQDDRPECA